MTRLRQAALLTRPVARSLHSGPLLAGPAVALAVSALPRNPLLQVRLGALALCLGASFLLDDPAESTLQSSPRTLLFRRTLRIALAAPPIAASWALLLWRTGPPDIPTRTLELAALLAVTLALAAALGALAAGPAVLGLFVADWLLPPGWRLLDDAPNAHPRWALILALAALLGVYASLDPGRGRHSLKCLRPVPTRSSARR